MTGRPAPPDAIAEEAGMAPPEDARRAVLAQARTRMGVVALCFMAGYLAVVLRLVDLTLLRPAAEAAQAQAVMAQNNAAAENLPVDVPPLPAPRRADILDRHGTVMATTLKMDSLFVDATLVADAPATAAALRKILPDLDRDALMEKLVSGRRFVWIKRDITPRQKYAINALGDPALGFLQEDRRVYPAGALTAHVVGYTDVDGQGLAGVERGMNARLLAGDAALSLSIDMRVQHILRASLEKTVRKFSALGASGMVMDVRTGEILAMVSLPDFDPYRPAAADKDARFNRATLGVFEMGSTFKLFSTAAALDSGAVRMGSSFDASAPIKYGRFRISDYHPIKRSLTVPEIFMHSSNIGTARMALATGVEGLRDFYEKLGFFARPPLELPERGAPLYPRPWRDIHTMTGSYGHGIAVSPVHLMRAAAAMVNGGILVTPTLLAQADGRMQPEGPRVISEATSAQIRRLLALTVVVGTGKKGGVAGYNVGGKTGTAEKNIGGRYVRNKVMSSFLGVFPMDDPRYAVVAIVDEPQKIKETFGYATGGWVAAPVVADVVARMAPMYNMLPRDKAGYNMVKDMGKYLKEEADDLARAGNN